MDIKYSQVCCTCKSKKCTVRRFIANMLNQAVTMYMYYAEATFGSFLSELRYTISTDYCHNSNQVPVYI